MQLNHYFASMNVCRSSNVYFARETYFFFDYEILQEEN